MIFSFTSSSTGVVITTAFSTEASSASWCVMSNQSWTNWASSGSRWTPQLTHWGRVTHICVSKLTIIGLDNGLSPGRRQAIIWTNVGILLIRPLGTNFSEILIEIHTFSFKKIHLKMSSGKWRPSCLGLNVLKYLQCGIPQLECRYPELKNPQLECNTIVTATYSNAWLFDSSCPNLSSNPLIRNNAM